jgi:hypothetical protein
MCEGTALRDMEICRLGLAILHPIESIVGAQLEVRGPQSRQVLSLTREVYPQPMVDDLPGAMTEPFSELTLERSDFGKLHMRFDGDFFELEDQRNWGDATFKTYCTPLRLGFPRTVRSGTTIRNCVEVRFDSAPRAQRVLRAKQRPVMAAGSSPGRFPALGRAWSDSASLQEDHLPWRHFHLDASSENLELIRRLSKRAKDTDLEIGVVAQSERMTAVDFLTAFRDQGTRIARLLLYGASGSSPTQDAASGWLNALDRAEQSAVPLLAATRGHFVEFNRARVFDTPASGVAFPLTATAHADDMPTITENVVAIRAMTDTIRERTNLSFVSIAPLALHYPSIKEKEFPKELVAPWLAATLIHCAAAHVNSVTLADDVVEALRGSSSSSTVTFLTHLIECAGQKTHFIGNHVSPGLHVVLFESVHVTRLPQLLAANLALMPASVLMLGTPVRATRARNALTGSVLASSPEVVEIPALSVAWIDVQFVGASCA